MSFKVGDPVKILKPNTFTVHSSPQQIKRIFRTPLLHNENYLTPGCDSCRNLSIECIMMYADDELELVTNQGLPSANQGLPAANQGLPSANQGVTSVDDSCTCPNLLNGHLTKCSFKISKKLK